MRLRLPLDRAPRVGEDATGPVLRVAAIVPVTTAEGPGSRFGVWVQGCGLRCVGCCNPGMWSGDGGRSISVASLLRELDDAIRLHRVDGLTVLGGEPLEQIAGVTALCRGAAARGLGVLVFSGLRFDEAMSTPGFDALWSHVDTLVDGRYDATAPEPSPAAGGRRFIGSHNQTLRHRTDRYRDPSHWQGAPRIEVCVETDGRVTAHGEPTAVAELLRALRRSSADRLAPPDVPRRRSDAEPAR